MSCRLNDIEGDLTMTKLFVALGVAAVALSMAPAEAAYRHHERVCANYRHGHCVRWENHGRVPPWRPFSR
jgi:hypothetical protein